MKIIVAISGSSGSIYAKILLDRLKIMVNQMESIGVVMSDNAIYNWELEIGVWQPENYPFKFYQKMDFMAPFASGSAKYGVMIVCPCSMGMLGRIASGTSTDLITRAADVILKERRKLILVTREMPLNLIHIKNMETVTLAGGIICPATPSFYGKPVTVEDVAGTVIDRVLDLSGLEWKSFRWGE
jgi:4-hydroxy-3-polyprenylbenzoate decarboxylase